MILREYQKECLISMQQQSEGRYVIVMSTGLGKTCVFTEYINQLEPGIKVLILSHREELVNQPIKYIRRMVGIEQSNLKSDGESIICASVQTLVKRLDKFDKDYFDVIITDECQHSPAKTYQKIYGYFNFKIHFGFTATPNRFDNVRLDTTFDKIIYEKPLKWGIENKYLSDIYCKRFYINYDLKGIKTSNNDYQLKALDEVVNTDKNAKAIADIYHKHAVGSTLVFGISVSHCESIQKEISGSVVISAKTKDRSKIIEDFTSGKIKCIINCMIFTEGTDIPRVETIIMARPTKNASLYCLDLNTEILTNNGWKKYNDIDLTNDKSAAFNIKNNEITFETISNYIIRDLTENENYTSIQSNYIDIRVTNKHRVIYNTRRCKTGWRMEEANKLTNLKDGFVIPISGNYNYSGINITNDEVKFIAWVKTDGYINKLNNSIQITQSAKHMRYVDEIEQIIINCGMKYNKILIKGKTNFVEYREQYVFTRSKGKPRLRDKHLKGWGYLKEYLLTDKLWNMDNDQFDLFLEVCNKADGNKHIPKNWIKRSIDISKGNKEFIEKLQIACITRGYKANIKTFINSYNNEQYTIHIKKQSTKHLSSHFDNRPKFKNEEFKNEKCWCIENIMGTIITRRNGKVSIMGNCQMIGRGLRLHPNKKQLLLIDCCGTSNLNLCTAPSLLGINMPDIKKQLGQDKDIEGNLFDLPEKINKISDKPEHWIINYKLVDLWAKGLGFNFHGINLYKLPDGTFTLKFGKVNIKIPGPDELGTIIFQGKQVKFQPVLDRLYTWLKKNYPDSEYLWNINVMKRWGNKLASDKQIELVKRFCPNFDTSNLTKLQASQILNRFFNK